MKQEVVDLDKLQLEELKIVCLKVWEKYKWSPWWYYEEKIERVNSIKNPKDAYILINMFDMRNKKELRERMSLEMRDYYHEYFVSMLENYGIL